MSSQNNLLEAATITADRIYCPRLECQGTVGTATVTMGVSSFNQALNNPIKFMAYGVDALDACC